MRCDIESFPLLKYHCKMACDLDTKYQGFLQSIPSGKRRFADLPGIATSQDCILTIVTNGDIQSDISYILGRRKDDRHHIEDVTGDCFKSEIVTEQKESACVIVFAHGDITLKPPKAHSTIICVARGKSQVNVDYDNNVETEMTEKGVRQKLTNILGNPLFTFAEKVKDRITKTRLHGQTYDESRLLAEQAANALLSRRITPLQSTNANRIPDEVANRLNRMAETDGLLAFGLSGNCILTFVDDDIKNTTRRNRISADIAKVCEMSHGNLDSRVIFAPKGFLKPTAMKQGAALTNRTTGGSVTLGMVAGANILDTDELATSNAGSDGHGDSATSANNNDEQQQSQCVGVVLTCGHGFLKGNVAQLETEETELGKCIASIAYREDPAAQPGGHEQAQHGTDKDVLKYDIAVIKVNERSTKEPEFSDEHGNICNCELYRDTLSDGFAVYKKGAATNVTTGYIHCTDFQIPNTDHTITLCNTEQAYLIQGEGKKAFAEEGDSGSIVFFHDVDDHELETVQLLSVQSRSFDEVPAKKMGMPPNISYTPRADKCFDKLREQGINIVLPRK